MDKELNFAYFGTPDVAAETLNILKARGYVPSLIVTSPDRPQGRKMLLTPPPVKIWAEENGIPYIQPEDLRRPGLRKLSELDLSIVVAYGKIMPKEILSMPRLGSLNVHYSLLPKYRGASPVESAILNGEEETGVSIQKMVYKMDTGPVIRAEKVKILPDEKAPELRSRLVTAGGNLLAQILPQITQELMDSEPQDEAQATYCKKIKKEDGLIDLSGDPIKNYNKFRAYAYWPRTFFFVKGKRIIITDAALEKGKFIIKRIIPEGGKEIPYEKSIYAMA